MQTRDSKGKTVAEAVKKIYVGKIHVDTRVGRCYDFQSQYRKDNLEYEIDHCSLEYSQQKVYSLADKLNGIDVKGRI